jgi:hypothetical protein
MREKCSIFEKKHFYGEFLEENMQKLKNLYRGVGRLIDKKF